MKAQLLLAEAATGHQDGTISMLRAGITSVWPQRAPYGMQGALIARVEAGLGDAGNHPFDLRLIDEDGMEIMSRLQGNFGVTAGGGVSNLIMNFSTAFPKLGRYTFVFRVDHVQLDSCTVSVATPPTGPA